MRAVKPVPGELHADPDESAENYMDGKVLAMDALTATQPGVFVVAIKTIPVNHTTRTIRISHLEHPPMNLMYRP